MDPIGGAAAILASYLVDKLKSSKTEFSVSAWEWIRPLFLKEQDETKITLLIDDKEIIISSKDDLETSTRELTKKLEGLISEEPGFGSYLIDKIDVIYDEYLINSKANTKKNIDSSKRILDSIELIEKL